MKTMIIEGVEYSHPDLFFVGEEENIKFFEIAEGNLAGAVFGINPKNFVITENDSSYYDLAFDFYTVSSEFSEEQMNQLQEIVNSFIIITIGNHNNENKNYQ